MVSCKKWIDVEPKTNIENDRFFSTRLGFVEALNGVYLNMGNANSYGRNMTWGMVDLLGRTYTAPSSIVLTDVMNGVYTSSDVQNLISSTYLAQYNSIANLNNILEQLDKKGSILSPSEFNMVKGEALGLRAFLHFDMVRLFTKSYQDGGENTTGIPYVMAYKPVVTPRLTVKDAMDKILKDLEDAENLLKRDTITTAAYSPNKASAIDLRKARFNFYAVKATKARVYLWKGDKVNALKYAEEVISVANAKFPFVRDAQLTIASDTSKNKVFTNEHLFGLVVPKLATNYLGYLDSASAASNILGITKAIMDDQYQTTTAGATDLRRVYLLKDFTGLPVPNNKIFFTKLHQPAFSNRMPLIKIPEMYYIAAECLADTDPTKAINYLNMVRTARGIPTPLVPGTAVLADEIRREYRKEMPNEGQIFFYYKRINTTTMPQLTGVYSTLRYVLPLPQAEIDFGN